MNAITTEPATKLIDGQEYMLNVFGSWIPKRMIPPQTLLEDQTVRDMVGRAAEMHQALVAFRENAFDTVDAFMALLAEQYGAKGRSNANTQLTSFDGRLKVEISTGNFLTLGPELQAAKLLIDECLSRWSEGANDNLRAIVNDAFAVGAEGKLRVDRILALRRVAIDDPAWKRAMEAISDAVRVTRSKRYVRFHRRENESAPWEQITLDVARV